MEDDRLGIARPQSLKKISVPSLVLIVGMRRSWEGWMLWQVDFLVRDYRPPELTGPTYALVLLCIAP